ncbi:hypothetical protein ACU8V1_13975 [Rhizobium leguminosarum]
MAKNDEKIAEYKAELDRLKAGGTLVVKDVKLGEITSNDHENQAKTDVERIGFLKAEIEGLEAENN